MWTCSKFTIPLSCRYQNVSIDSSLKIVNSALETEDVTDFRRDSKTTTSQKHSTCPARHWNALADILGAT